MLSFDKDKLQKVLRAFNISTGARVAIFNSEQIEIAAYPKNQCPLCQNLRKIKVIDTLCIKSDARAFDICKMRRAPYLYRCRAGLFEAVAPIIFKNEIEGYIMMGQVVSSKEEVLSRVKTYVDDTSQIETLLAPMQTTSAQALESLTFLMNVCMEYLCMSSLLLKSTPRAQKIDEFLQSNIQNQLCANDVAKHFRLSRATIHQILKEAWDMSLTERMNFLRIKTAQDYLINGEKVEDVAIKVGFSDKNYFYKNFKRYTKMTVKEFLFAQK